MEPSCSAPHPSDGGRPLVDAPTRVSSLRRRLLQFFDAQARALPWRRTEDPYAIWVSEVMLQQTRVDTVIPYYERWMERYPTVSDLAEAPLEDVLKSWEGLGYYRRARLLHQAAAWVRERHGGRVPSDLEGLRELPGVGDYTAGAVASIAFGQAVPAVDGNVRRVLSRLDDLSDPTPADLRDLASVLVDPERPGAFNQALMELGATVCRPRSPACGTCPVAEHCRARALGVQEARPAPRRRGPVPERRFVVAVPVRRVRDAWWTLLLRRPPEGLLGGMWEFPTGASVEGEDGMRAAARTLLVRAASESSSSPSLSSSPPPASSLPEVRHAYSHFRGVYRPFLFPLQAGDGPDVPPAAPVPGTDDARWVRLEGLGEVPVPVAQQRIAAAARARLADG